MGKVSKTSYFCDSCAKEVERARDLIHFDTANHGRGGRGAYSPHAQTQLCDNCSANLLLSLATFGFNVDVLGIEGIQE